MKVIILDDWEKFFLHCPVLDTLKEYFDVEIYHDVPTKDILIERLKGADVVIPIRERTKFSKDILQNSRHVKLIAQTGAGLAHIDMEEANRLRIPVATTPGGSAGVVELTFSYMLAYSRQLIRLHKEMRRGIWTETIGSSLEGRTIGIIGLGKIGSRIANIAKAFGMRVLAWGPRLTEERAKEAGVEYTSLEQLLQESHFVSVNVRLVAETTHLLQAHHFDMMRKDAFLINTSRGEVIDEKALVSALQVKRIGGAGLDVFSHEPLTEDHPLLTLDNVILTPHIGWKTDRMFTQFFSVAVENIISFLIKDERSRIVNNIEIN